MHMAHVYMVHVCYIIHRILDLEAGASWGHLVPQPMEPSGSCASLMKGARQLENQPQPTTPKRATATCPYMGR